MAKTSSNKLDDDMMQSNNPKEPVHKTKCQQFMEQIKLQS